MKQNRSKRNKTREGQVGKIGQTGQTGRTNGAKRAAKLDKSARRVVPEMDKESLSAGEAARELGVSPRTLRRLCSLGRLPSFLTPGGQVRVWRNHLDAYLQGLPPKAAGPPSPVLENKREALQGLSLELQERRLRRDLRKLDDEDADAERERAASIEAEGLRDKVALEQFRLQRENIAQERERQREQLAVDQERQQWIDSWLEYALRSLPRDVPREVVSDVREAVEGALSTIEASRSQSIVQHLVAGAIETGLKPWRRQQEIEKSIQHARKELPWQVQTLSDWSPPNEWEVRAMSAARDAIAKLVLGAPLGEVRAAAIQAGRRVAMEYEAEQDRIRAEQQRQRLASNKSYLISLGVAEVGSYLKKLHSDDEIFDEDLDRKAEIERTVRSVLEGRLTGGELFLEALRIAREAVDEEL